MIYQSPHLSVQQEFQAVPPDVRSDQIALLLGPVRKVSKPGVAPDSEISYGDYDPAEGSVMELDGLPSGESADDGSVEVVLNEVLARYATISGNNKIEVGTSPHLVSLGSGLAGVAFVAGDGANRAADLQFRDVRLGDRVSIDHESGTLLSRVTGFVDSMSAPVVGSLAAGNFNVAANPPTVPESFSSAITTSSVDGRVVGDVADGEVGYVGDLSKGIVSESYVLTVTTGGTYLGAALSWSSSNGDDSGSGTVPANGTTAMTIGTRGASVKLVNLGTRALVAGEVFTITVAAEYDRASATASGTYTGAVDTAYVISVIKGGTWAQSPKVSVVSNNGHDSSSVQTVAANDQAIVLGNKGLSIVLGAGLPGLRLGDVFVVSVTSSKPAGKRTIRLAHPIPTDDDGDAVNAAGYDLTVRFLSRQVRLELPSVSYPEFGSENWTHDGTSVDLAAAIEVLDPTVLDGSGSPIPIPVFSADVEIHYTAVLRGGALVTRTISSASSVEGILGPPVPENELAFAAYCALLNSGGVHVVTIQTAGTSVADYNQALRVAERMSDIYFVVPASSDPEVIESVQGHIGAMNQGRKGMERMAIVNIPARTSSDLFVTKEDDSSWTGYVGSDGNGGFTLLTIPGATFVDAGVRPGDLLRTNFVASPDGTDTHSTYQILEVVDQESALLVSGPASSVGSAVTPVRAEVFRINTPREVAEFARDAAEAVGNRKVVNVWPDTLLTSSGQEVKGHAFAAAVAGLASSMVAHQPITEFEIQGFSEIPMLLQFTPDELDIAAGGGNLIAAQDRPGGRIYIRHQLSTDNTGPLTSEISITRGADMVARYLRSAYRPLVGKWNITPEFLQMVETLGQQRLDAMVLALKTVTAGPPILSNERIRAFQDPSSMTGFIVDVPAVFPKPANNGTIRIYIS